MPTDNTALVTSRVHHQEKKWGGSTVIHANDIAFHQEHSTNFALLALLRDPMMEWIHPHMYMKAAGEMLALTMLISWILTFAFNPIVVKENPLYERLGYNNLCVGWDTPPANLVASVLYIFCAYLVMRFNYVVHARCLLNPDTSSFTYWANIVFLLAAAGFVLVFMIPPTQSVYGHSIPFMFYILGRGMIVLALAFEDWDTLDSKGKIFFYFYAAISIAVPAVILSEYIYYSEHGVKSPWPGKVTMIIDYSWFACLALTSKFLPNGMALHRTFELQEDPDA